MSGVQQGESINACVLLCVRDRCLSNNRGIVVLCCVAIVGLVDRSDGRYGEDAKARCVNVVFVRRWVYRQYAGSRQAIVPMLRSAQQCLSRGYIAQE